MDIFLHSETWISLLMLTFMEIVLGIDNIIFISIASNRVAKEQQAKARNIGLLMAMLLRIALLFGITYVLKMQEPWFSVEWEWLHAGFTGQSLILFVGGIFLLYKSVSEIHHKLEGVEEQLAGVEKTSSTLTKTVIQITLLNIVFSFDSILTAIGLTESVLIMIIAVIVSIGIMIAFATPVARFVNEHPTVQMLGMAFLLLIGFTLVAEGAHVSHLSFFGQVVGEVPKGYLYFAIFFSLAVEVLNMKVRKNKKKPVVLRNPKLKE
ncbi:MAG: TerC family protein [Flavobacteriaceae bacterium]|nr:TerC family protein [Flavobacteriaceae bacterium]